MLNKLIVTLEYRVTFLALIILSRGSLEWANRVLHILSDWLVFINFSGFLTGILKPYYNNSGT